MTNQVTTTDNGTEMTSSAASPDAAGRSENKSLGTASLILGICSLCAGWLVVAPIIGLVLGIKSRSQEPLAHGRAMWGIVLNSVCLMVWVILLAIVVVGIWIGALNQ